MVQWKQANVESMDGEEKNKEKEKVYYGSLWSHGADQCVDAELEPIYSDLKVALNSGWYTCSKRSDI